jgi:hypothetical protein
MEGHWRRDGHRLAAGRRRERRRAARPRQSFLIKAGDAARTDELDRADVSPAVDHKTHSRSTLTAIPLGIRRHALEAREMGKNSA